MREFTRRLTYFVLIGNGDAHLKNWSLIYRDRHIPTLSPVYDVVATESYRPRGDPEDLGLKFFGSRRFETVRVGQFGLLARKLGSRAPLEDVASEVVARVGEEWPRFAEELSTAPTIREAVDDAIRHRSQTLLGRANTGGH